uniref:Large ribosomal subunit protein uL23 n=1 Tax=Candidatus Kentrum eta TaxID=2126337 RepID=A0A450VGC3_9GAMM|nr:MAG: LSU ribosomal protein L23P [Candidatus Kentron sp. H]VFJ99613.1 MAG: LSU ribosomal protein L23P [Candidatus Kentron sp. H]VFK03892.1 MAG: LSU ribosomal protein L23P [Candidatus Kentron sp. H]
MKQKRMMAVLRFPHMSEKSTRVADDYRQIVFRVARDANKLEIKKAVERMFGVQVKKVCILNVKGKRKPLKSVGKGRFGYRLKWKKAYVMLAPGNDIDFLNVTSAL